MIDLDRLKELLAGGETLEVEFKSDRMKLNDNGIYEEVVALANTKGGVLMVS